MYSEWILPQVRLQQLLNLRPLDWGYDLTYAKACGEKTSYVHVIMTMIYNNNSAVQWQKEATLWNEFLIKWRKLISFFSAFSH